MLLWLSLLFKRRRSIPHNVESAGRLTCAFYNLQLFRSNLTSVTIPNSLTSVRADAFRGCPIEKIYIEKGDAERVRELLRGKGIDVDKVEFVEREEAQPDCATSNNANGQLK